MGEFFRTYKTVIIVVGVILALAAVIGGGWAIYDGIYDKGYNQAKSDIAEENRKAKELADANVAKQEKQHEKNIRKIQAMPDNNYGVGPITSSVLDGLPEPR